MRATETLHAIERDPRRFIERHRCNERLLPIETYDVWFRKYVTKPIERIAKNETGFEDVGTHAAKSDDKDQRRNGRHERREANPGNDRTK